MPLQAYRTHNTELDEARTDHTCMIRLLSMVQIKLSTWNAGVTLSANQVRHDNPLLYVTDNANWAVDGADFVLWQQRLPIPDSRLHPDTQGKPCCMKSWCSLKIFHFNFWEIVATCFQKEANITSSSTLSQRCSTEPRGMLFCLIQCTIHLCICLWQWYVLEDRATPAQLQTLLE